MVWSVAHPASVKCSMMLHEMLLLSSDADIAPPETVTLPFASLGEAK